MDSITAEELVARKERQGLRLQYRLRILVNLVYIVATLTIGTGKTEEIVLVPLVVGLFLILNTVLYLMTRRVAANAILPYLGILLDTALIATLALVLHQVMGTETTPFSFVLKSDIYPATVLLLLFHLINFQPRIVLFSGSLLLALNVTMLAVSIATSPYPLTRDFGEGFTSYRINLEFETGKLVIFVLMTGIAYFISDRVRKTIQEAATAEVHGNQLRRYFSPKISESIIQSQNGGTTGGRIQEVAVLFTDIRNFTGISETMTPDEVLSFLTEYHQTMVTLIFKNGGTLDKFIGDSIMATFGTPAPGEDDAANAIRTALEMERALGRLNERREQEGKFPIRHRIGIHMGPVLAGNIGTRERLEYTVIGDTVNTASRIEQACKSLDRSLLVSEELTQKTGDRFRYGYVGKLRLKGKSQDVKVYTVESESPAQA